MPALSATPAGTTVETYVPSFLSAPSLPPTTRIPRPPTVQHTTHKVLQCRTITTCFVFFDDMQKTKYCISACGAYTVFEKTKARFVLSLSHTTQYNIFFCRQCLRFEKNLRHTAAPIFWHWHLTLHCLTVVCYVRHNTSQMALVYMGMGIYSVVASRSL